MLASHETENVRLKRDLAWMTEREAETRRVAEKLSSDTLEGRVRQAKHADELQAVSKAMTSQLHTMEQELAKQAQKYAELLDAFLRNILQPLGILHSCCVRLSRDMDYSAKVPPLCEANVHDLRSNLAKVVNVVRFAAEVL